MAEQKWCTGTPVTLQEVLDSRENRSDRQQEILSKFPGTLISFTLNIVGPVKSFPLTVKTFQEGMIQIRIVLALNSCLTLYEETRHLTTGSEGLFVVDAYAPAIKKQLAQIEDTHMLGRIFDIDVFDNQKDKISRESISSPSRTCLLCSSPVFLCSRSRNHPVSRLLAKELEMMAGFFKDQYAALLAGLFTKAMIYEVTTTPKPGLVDRHHNGAHTDMNIGMFMDSIDALRPYYYKCTYTGSETPESDLETLFPRLRKLGIQAEASMSATTGGVNTHKGLIFSGGILCGLLGYLYTQEEAVKLSQLPPLCRMVLKELSQDFESLPSKPEISHGEKLFLKYGLTGIRGEAYNGFTGVIKTGLPAFKKARSCGRTLFASGRTALLHLIASTEDTNIIIRSSYQTWKKLQKHLQKYLDGHETGTYDEGQIISQLDQYFIKENISPGGSADLLALVYFLTFLEDRGLLKC